MDKQKFLNEKYQKLCQQLGDAHFKRNQLNEHISNLESAIASLNDAFPLIAELEARQAQEAALASKASKANGPEILNGGKND